MRFSLYELLHFLLAMNVLIVSGSASVQYLCKCFRFLATLLIVVSSYASFFIQSIVFIIEGDVVVIEGDDVAVPV